MEPVPVEILAKEVACTLEPAAVPGRIGEWHDLLARADARTRLTDGAVELRFAPADGLAVTIADLAAREQSCCAFFEFTVRISAEVLVLEVRAPAEAAALLDAFLG